MAKKKQFVTAAAAFAVAASAVAPAITADAATQTVRLSSDYVRTGNLDATLDKEYNGGEIHWYKSSVDMNKLGVFQTAKGFVKGQGIKVEKRVRVLNYAQEIQPTSEFVFEQGVPVSGIRVQPVLFADGNLYEKPLFVAGFDTDKVGEFEGTLTYSNSAYGTVTKTVKYKVVATKVAISDVQSEVKDDVLSVTAAVKNLKDGEKVELVVYAGRDMNAALPAVEAQVKDGLVTIKSGTLPAGNHSFILRSGEVKTEVANFTVEAPMVKEVKALNLKQVEVKFNKDLDKASAETVTNYELKIGSDAATNPATAEVTSEGTVLLTFAVKNQSTDAKLTVKNVKTAKNIVVAETTKDVRFLDVVAPTVGEISIVAPRVIRVNFSEPLKDAPTFKLNNGQTAIVSTSWSAGQDYADLTIGIDPENGSSHSLEISGGADYAGFKIDAVTKSFVYQTDATAPKAMISKVVDNNTVEIKFDKEINATTLTGNLEIFHTVKGGNGYKAAAVTGVKPGTTDTIVVDFPNAVFPQGEVKFFLDYNDSKGTIVQDKWGNKLPASELYAVYAADTVAPTLVSVEGKTKTTIEVKFSEEVTKASAELAGNIVLTDSDNKVVAQTATLAADGKTVTLTSSELAGGNYKVTVKNVTDSSSNKIAEVSRTFYVNDMVAPTVNTSADLLAGNKKVKIKFSEAMNAASITDKAKYKYDGADLDSKVTITAVDGNKAVILDFSAVTGFVSASEEVIIVGRVADAAGNLTADFSNTVTVSEFQSTVAASKAEVTGSQTVKVYFDEIIVGAVANDFVVTSGTARNTTNLVNSIVDGKSVLTLTVDGAALPFNATGVSVASSTEAGYTVKATNNDGLLVTFTAKAAEDKFAPEIASVVFTETGVATAADQLTVNFTEGLYAPSVQDSDFAVAGRVIESISYVDADTITINLKADNSATSAKPASVSIVNTIEDAERNAKSSQVFTDITTP
ncbi:hypothetical protein L479_01219 [Exiguobacterium sp. S17]|nr:hypothetical protein L479_01219 [Exiguobacterium sp. S17]